MAIEIVDFPMKNGGSFQFAMLNYQRVSAKMLVYPIEPMDYKWYQIVDPAGDGSGFCC
jgi:hypothetical protein